MDSTVFVSLLQTTPVDLELIETQLKNGYDLNKRLSNGDTYLYLRHVFENLDILKLFIKYNIDVNEPVSTKTGPDGKGFTLKPLDITIFNGYVDATKILLDAGADMYSRNYSGSTPLHRLMNTSDVFSKEMFFLLKSAGADFTVTDNYGIKPLDLIVNKTNRDLFLKLSSLESSLESQIKETESKIESEIEEETDVPWDTKIVNDTIESLKQAGYSAEFKKEGICYEINGVPICMGSIKTRMVKIK